MKNAAPILALTAALGLLLGGAATAQTTGHIQYEVTKLIDPNDIRVVVNGQVVKPGSPDFPTDIPMSRTIGLSLTFAGSYAREERESSAISTTTTSTNGAPGVPQTTVIKRPFEETTYLDLAGRATTTVLTLKDPTPTAYRSDKPFAPVAGWKLSPQTKKIAGYLCHKATVLLNKETYTVWYTTDLPFTYSPKRELVPEHGVVLALESEREQYQATKIDTKAVPEAEVRPAQTAQAVTPEELKDLREKALADFRQQLIQNEK
ncbi:GLPGLI family protein [Hymenobacter negativus]|uniref:GLPGLI family protein n=1 Tax=Hymenobacter negativus TaxID=2795026 RepID=A0ABS3Q9R8_9BACT|nr:GLPGLI family protein [Hymenobacter negativus]MBO2007992.1 GLPGLI family protein [Hymenobacter negativus]